MSGLPASKRCARCETEKPAAAFYTRKTANGIRFQSYCKVCTLEAQAERRRRPGWEKVLERRREMDRRRKEDPEYLEGFRRYQREDKRMRRRLDPEFRRRELDAHRRWVEKAKQQPGYLERQRQLAREAYAIRRDKAGKRPRVPRGDLNHKGSSLSIEPFREWLRWFLAQERDDSAPADKKYVSAYVRIAGALGLSEGAANRAVYRWLNESKAISLDYADALLTRLDSPARLYELWPELAEGEQVS